LSDVDLYRQPFSYQYFTAAHCSVLLLLGAEVGPRATLETFLAALGLYGGALIKANLFGELAVLAWEVQQKSTRYQQKMSEVNS
jgi:hypothetical protein